MLLLTTLIATAVLATGSARARWDLAVAARQVALDLDLARARAIAENRDQRVQFTAGSGSYSLQRVVAGTATPYGAPIHLPTGVRVQSCNGRDSGLQFRPRGSASSFGTVVLENGGGTRRVVLNIAGHVRIS